MMSQYKNQKKFCQSASDFYRNLNPSFSLPDNVEIINPYENEETRRVTQAFFKKFFNDTRRRVFVLGINPGRIGSGTTGIPFTDAVALQEKCNIPHSLPLKSELSATFVYTFIEKWGGAQKFYQDFYLTALSPIGFLRDGRNLNFYDDDALFRTTQSFIIKALEEQMNFGAKNTAIIFGSGKNQKVFNELNERYHFFQNVLVLEHPRYIAQYKRKELQNYLQKYKDTFERALSL